MNVEIICVGTELLLGDILNTNAKFLSERLAELGFNLFSQSVVGDNAERLERQIAVSLSRSNIVVLSGGLGPTEDDITKETVAKVLNLTLEEDSEVLKRIRAYFSLTGRNMTENNQKQALVIKGAKVLHNEHGTAPGMFLEVPTGAVILLPGPPSELVPMFNEKVMPLLSKYSNSTIVSSNVRLFGVGESAAAEACGELLNSKNPTVATYAKPGEVDIRVTASAENPTVAKSICNPVIKQLVDIFGNHVYGVNVDTLQHKVVDLLKQHGKKLATAESCTAGMLSERITEIPGSSDVFEMGVTAYANYVKVQALGVSEEVIKEKGAVSAEVAAQMAVGIRSMCNADIGVGITGVAGPGQSEGKPAGLVYISIADNKNVYVRKILTRGTNRDTTRVIATSTALDMVRRYLEGCQDLLVYGTPIGSEIKLMEKYEAINSSTSKVKKSEASQLDQEKQIYSDEELLNMFSTIDEDLPEDRPEKLEIKDDSIEFVFDCDDDEEDHKYYKTNIYSTKKNNDDLQQKSEEKQPKALNNKETETNAKKRGFFASLFPCKGDPISEKIRKIIFIVAFIVLICTMIYLINYFVEGWNSQNQIANAATVWDKENSHDKNEKGIFIAFESLMEQNKDIRAWMKIEGTNINNPVYQTTDNKFYVTHDMNRQSSRYGALFIDKDASVGRDKNSQNLVVYGHHMKDGTMFGPLKKYTDISFYKEHPIIDFTTLYREGQYKVFSVFITSTIESHDNGNVFNYRRSTFEDENSFLSFVDELKKRSIIDTGVDVQGDDEILTLSTCTYEFEEARLVVVARRIRDDEVDATDTSLAKVNPNPLYPQIWYDKKGGKKPVFSSSSEQAASSSEVLSSSEVASSEEAVSGFNAGTVSTSSATSSAAKPSSKPAPSSSSKVSSSTPNPSSSKPTPSSSSSAVETSSEKPNITIEPSTPNQPETSEETLTSSEQSAEQQ